MAVNYKILGQEDPVPDFIGQARTLYTVPANTQALISTLVVCNRNNAASTFSIACRPAGASLLDKHYINFNVPIAANDSINLTLGISLAATDVITVVSGNGQISFTAFGSEITAA